MEVMHEGDATVPSARPGTSRRVRIEEWTYDFRTGNCVKFRTVEKTVASSKLRRKFRKTWNKAKIRIQNSMEDFGHKLRIGGRQLPQDDVVFDESESDSQYEAAEIGTIIQEKGQQQTDFTPSKGTFHIQTTSEKTTATEELSSATETVSIEDQKEEPLQAEEEEKELEEEDEKWFLSSNDLQETLIYDQKNVAALSEGSVIAVNNDNDVRVIKIVPKKDESEVSSVDNGIDPSGATCTTQNSNACSFLLFPDEEHPTIIPTQELRHVSCHEVYLDLSKMPCGWDTIENLIHEANVLGYKRHTDNEEYPIHKLPKGITVLGTSESISRLKELLSDYGLGYGDIVYESFSESAVTVKLSSCEDPSLQLKSVLEDDHSAVDVGSGAKDMSSASDAVVIEAKNSTGINKIRAKFTLSEQNLSATKSEDDMATHCNANSDISFSEEVLTKEENTVTNTTATSEPTSSAHSMLETKEHPTTPSLLTEIQRVIYFMLGQASENIRMSEEEMLKIISTNLMSYTAGENQPLTEQKHANSDFIPETHTINTSHQTKDTISLERISDMPKESHTNLGYETDGFNRIDGESSPFSEKMPTLIHIDERDGTSDIMIQNDFGVQSAGNQIGSEFTCRHSSSGPDVGDCVGDGLSNNIPSEDVLRMSLEMLKKESLSRNESLESNNLVSQLTKLENISPHIDPQEAYQCKCYSLKQATQSNEVNIANIQSSPVISNETLEEPKNSIHKLQFLVSHCGPCPSKFEIKFEEDIECEVSKNLDQWRIHFGEKVPNQDSIPFFNAALSSSNPEISTGNKRLFASSGRHFEFIFSEDMENLRLSANIQDQQTKHKERRLIRKSATTI